MGMLFDVTLLFEWMNFYIFSSVEVLKVTTVLFRRDLNVGQCTYP
jgi:hypothetical protein